MKLRLSENSIRLRLQTDEITRLSKDEKISETIDFGTSKLIYTLEISSEINILSARFENNEIIIGIPQTHAKHWIESNKIGFETAQKISDAENLKILIEKDFARPEHSKDAGDANK